jgi:hypothetical protein
MTEPRPTSSPRITLATCMLLIAAIGLLLAATRYWGRGRWLFVLLIVAMGALHRAVFAVARGSRIG